LTDSPDYFSVRAVESGDEPVVVVEGEIDLGAAEPLWHVITGVLAQGPKRLVVDMVDTTFIDSSGLEVLLRAHAALGRLPEAMVLRAPSPSVRRVLGLAGITDLFAYEPDGDADSSGDGSGGGHGRGDGHAHDGGGVSRGA
jgi:anti-anti-sigma factor